MITEDYVSFEVAKLLKEKGFDEACWSWYHNGNNTHTGTSRYCNSELEKYDFSKATLAHVMKWLRKEHKLHIQIWILEEKGYWFDIEKILNAQYKHKSLYSTGLEEIYFESYEQAAEAAIKYCLEKLI